MLVTAPLRIRETAMNRLEASENSYGDQPGAQQRR
jgi:hypothetical protein